MKIEEVIKAFLLNLRKKNTNPSKEDGEEFSNDDLLKFFAPNSSLNTSEISQDDEVEKDDLGSKICFALSKNRRHFMDIASLCDIK